MKVSVDTNILLDILLPDPKYKDTSYDLLTKYMKSGQLIICEIVYAELAVHFTDYTLLEKFLSDVDIRLIPLCRRAMHISAKAWREYIKNRSSKLQCRKCGKEQICRCMECGSVITSRQHVLPDFLIAGHALHESGMLLTRDRGYYKSYFPALKTQYGI